MFGKRKDSGLYTLYIRNGNISANKSVEPIAALRVMLSLWWTMKKQSKKVLNIEKVLSSSISILIRLAFFGFLACIGMLGVYAILFSLMEGINPLSIYLSLSLLLFLGTGVLILFYPAKLLFSDTLATKVIWSTFFFSLVQPFLGLLIVKLLFFGYH